MLQTKFVEREADFLMMLAVLKLGALDGAKTSPNRIANMTGLSTK